MRTHSFANDYCYIIIETLFGKISGVKKHYGPIIENYADSMRFIEKNKEYDKFFEDGRYVTYKKRELTHVHEIIENAVRKEFKSMGKDVADYIRDAVVLKGLDLLEIKDELAEFLCISEKFKC